MCMQIMRSEKKPESKSQNYAFIGYGRDKYHYRLQDYKYNRLMRRKDVVFSEDYIYKDRIERKNEKIVQKEHINLHEPEDGDMVEKEEEMHTYEGEEEMMTPEESKLQKRPKRGKNY